MITEVNGQLLYEVDYQCLAGGARINRYAFINPERDTIIMLLSGMNSEGSKPCMTDDELVYELDVFNKLLKSFKFTDQNRF